MNNILSSVLIKKQNKKNRAFILPMAIAVLGVIIAISTILISMVVNQNTSNSLQIQKMERENLCLQLEYDFTSLNSNQFKQHILFLGGEEDSNKINTYRFLNKKYTLSISEDYKLLQLENESNKIILKIKVNNERKIIEKIII